MTAFEGVPTEQLDLGREQVEQTRARGAVLTLGSQSEEAIKRMCEDLGADMVMLPFDTPADQLRDLDFVVGSGGASGVHEEDVPQLDPEILSEDFEPLFIGICLSSQIMVHQAGGTVHEEGAGTYGSLEVTVLNPSKDKTKPMAGFEGLEKTKLVHSNGNYYELEDLPEHFEAIAMTGTHVAAYRDTRTGNIGYQPHPELSDAMGYGIFRNALNGAGIKLEPRPEDQFATMLAEINELAGDGTVDFLLGLSGGIDSNLVADVLVASNVPPERLHIVMLDLATNRTVNGVSETDIALDLFERRTGIRPHLRRKTPDEVFETPVELFDENNASLGFRTLSKVTHSEEKRLVFSQIYGNEFADFIEEEGLDPNNTLLVQGTLYPDVVESIGSGKVKTHHNMGPVFVYLEKNGRVANPARRYFKGDMRRMGKERGMTQEEYDRQPFPGPGGIPRIFCYDGELILPENAMEKWEQAKYIVGDEFGVVLAGFRTVGQKGDKRSFAWPIMLTGEPDWERMNALMVQLGNEMPDTVNRVYYLSGDRVDGLTTEDVMTTTMINEETVSQWQGLDDRGNRILEATGALALNVTDQIPIGLMPTAFHPSDGARTMYWRPFRTPKKASFLSGEAVLPTEEPAIAEAFPLMEEMALATPGIERVAFDIAHKPFASTEGE